MGNSSKDDSWLPAEHLRIMMFARSLGPPQLDDEPRKKPTASEIQDVLGMLTPEIIISDTTINKWLKGEDHPGGKNQERIQKDLPRCTAWLKPDENSSPISRFLCALDVWGSRIDSPVRKLDIASTGITVGSGLAALSKRWGSVPSPTNKYNFSLEYDIPRLSCRVPQQVPFSVYQPLNPLTLMEFMFRCGSYLELSDEEFTEWAIDLASLTLLISAFIEGRAFAERFQFETICAYNALPFSIFFRGHGKWPNLASVNLALEDFPELNDSIINYADRLMRAREVLRMELQFIGSDLSIANQLSLCIEDRDRMSQMPPDILGETFRHSDLLRVKPKIQRNTSRKYRYEFRHLTNGRRIVLCHDLVLCTVAPLPKRPDLFGGYPGTFNWGYKGEGPKFLTISMLAHHFDHDNFGLDEIEHLLYKWISLLPERLVETSFFTTTEQIDNCLNK